MNDLPGKTKFSWSLKQKADLRILFIEPIEGKKLCTGKFQRGRNRKMPDPFRDRASLENGIICWAALLALGYTPRGG